MRIDCDRVDQPVGTGFATGKPTATSQEEIAEDFIKFFKNFQEIFGIKNYKIYVTGESYAGRYVPYISAAMLDQNDTEYYDLKGELLLSRYCCSHTDRICSIQVPSFMIHASASSTTCKKKCLQCPSFSRTRTCSTSMQASWRSWKGSTRPAATRISSINT